MTIKGFLARWKTRRRFPRVRKRFWYCGEMITYSSDLYREGKPCRTRDMELPCDRFIVNPYSDSGGKIPKVGDILPCIKIDGLIGYYEVLEKRRYSSAGSDFAPWDDGYEIDLKLHHCERAK